MDLQLLRAAGAGALALVLLTPCGASAQETTGSRAEVEAAYLYHLATLTTWPAGTFPAETAPLAVCVLGEDPFGGLLDTVLGAKEAGGRPIRVLRLGNASGLDPCQMVYLGGPLDDDARTAIARAASNHLLVVTSDREVWEAGGAVRFATRRGKLVLDIDEDAVGRAGLEMDDFLLAFAKRSGG